MPSLASMHGDEIMDDWLHIFLTALGIFLLEFGFGWLSQKRLAETTIDRRVLELERIGELQRSLDELRKEKEEFLSTELAATKTVLSSFVKEQEELLEEWKNLLVAQEIKHSEGRKPFPCETKVPQFIPVNDQQGFDFGAQEPEGDLYEEDQAANRPVDREWLQARFAEYMVTVGGEDVESGGCPSPDYGVCDHSD